MVYFHYSKKQHFWMCRGVLSALTNRESANKLNETQKGKEK